MLRPRSHPGEGSNLPIDAYGSGEVQMLHGAPTGTYSKPSGAKADELPAVGAVCRESVVDDLRLRRVVEVCFDVANSAGCG